LNYGLAVKEKKLIEQYRTLDESSQEAVVAILGNLGGKPKTKRKPKGGVVSIGGDVNHHGDGPMVVGSVGTIASGDIINSGHKRRKTDE
jgi:hypothetical protein